MTCKDCLGNYLGYCKFDCSCAEKCENFQTRYMWAKFPCFRRRRNRLVDENKYSGVQTLCQERESTTMTNEEAIKILKEEMRRYKCIIDSLKGGADSLTDGEAPLKSRGLAIKALEKQIPKKPTFEGDGFDENGNIIYDTWICPCCEEEYEVDYDDHKYCPWCGQMIDWSDFK